VLDFNTVDTLRRLVPPERTAKLSALLPALSAAPDPDVLDQLFEINASFEEDLVRTADDLAENISQEIEIQNSHFVGFKLWSGDGFLASVRIAERLRQRFPRLQIYGGGPAVLYSEHAVYAHTKAFNALVDGEGELAILGLAAHAEEKGALADVPNLILWDGNSFRRTVRSMCRDINTLAYPSYSPEVYPSLTGDRQIKLFVLDESRGCPMGCAFCIHQDASGNRWRMKSAARLLDEIQEISAQFGVSTFMLGGSYTPAKFFREFANRLMEEDGQIRFCGFAHPGGLPDGLVDQLSAVGCKSLFLGVESFDTSDLVKLGKQLDIGKAKAVIRSCLEAGIVPVVSVIVPVPGQTAEGLNTTLESLVDLCKGTPSTVCTGFPGLLPRTRWWAERSNYGFDLQVGEDEYRKILATYKIRHIIPPAFWEPLPYALDGNDFSEYAGANARFQRSLVREGVAVNISYDVTLLADVVECELFSFRSTLQKLFFTLDAEALSRFVADVNGKLIPS
jgi:radical SAM superfamily enzyme YgiQ (UPF0313 family)